MNIYHRHGAEEVGAGPSRTGRSVVSFAFKGAGYRLGDSEAGPIRPVPGTAGTLPEKDEEVRSSMVIENLIDSKVITR